MNNIQLRSADNHQAKHQQDVMRQGDDRTRLKVHSNRTVR